MQKASPVDPTHTQELEQFAARYPFPLDAFQREAIEQLAQDRSVVVTAPTGTGKTIVAEYAIWRALQRHQQVIYTTPLKALSNQKYRDFRTLYGVENVGLLTGDVSEQRLAPIVVMTTEVYRNMLLEAEREEQRESEHAPFSPLSKIGFLIFDELHYISDAQRGPVWEEAIICTPEHIQLVGLSATVSNAHELVDWISRVHRPAVLVSHDQRAIPLEHYYLLDGTLHLVQDAQGQRVARFPYVGGEARATLRQPGHRSFSLKNRKEETVRGPHTLRSQKRQARASTQMHPSEPATSAASSTSARRKPHQLPTVDDVLAALEQADFLPCLYFLPGRRLVEETARGVSLHSFTSPEEQELILHEIEQWRESLSREDRDLPQVRTLTDLLPRGIAFHHAGLLPGLKVVVETLFVRGHLRVVFATDTLALGVNMPARAVVVGSLSKFDGERMRLLTPNEYRQLTGRAGRRGLDVRGAAIIPYSPWEPFEDAFARITGEQLPVTSAFSIRYNTVLNLWRPKNVEVLEYVCAANLCEYQRAGQRQQRERQRTVRGTQRATGKKKNRQTRARPVGKLDVVPLDFPALSSVGEAELEGIIATLRTLDYIGHDEHLTLKGHLLRRIFHPTGILVVELLLQGALLTCSPSELAEVVSWFTYESDRRLHNTAVLSRRLTQIRRTLWQIEEDVHAVEEQVERARTPETMPEFHSVILSWAHGLSLSALMRQVDMVEGDILMLLNQTIDLLQQVQSAVGHVVDAKLFRTNTVEFFSEDVTPSRRAKHHTRKQEQQVQASYAILSQLRPLLAQAVASLQHGLVQQSRTIPSMIAPIDEDLLPPDEEEDVDPQEVSTEQYEEERGGEDTLWRV